MKQEAPMLGSRKSQSDWLEGFPVADASRGILCDSMVSKTVTIKLNVPQSMDRA
jgi:hypothetical protein